MPFNILQSLKALLALVASSIIVITDEMGLGKTVELLACIFTHQVASSSVGNFTGEFLCGEGQKNSLKRLKRERVECICGSVSESIRYKGLWVQCDACDAWQHADCVGYSPNKRYSKSKAILDEQKTTGNMRKHAKRKNNVKIVEMEDSYICQRCSELIQACVAPVASGATLLVCPAPILPQWHAEIVRYSYLAFHFPCSISSISFSLDFLNINYINQWT